MFYTCEHARILECANLYHSIPEIGEYNVIYQDTLSQEDVVNAIKTGNIPENMVVVPAKTCRLIFG